MDLSYRAFLHGWSARYAGEVEVPAELPVSFTAYRRQQYRRARGSLECAIRYLPPIWNSQFSFCKKTSSHIASHRLRFTFSRVGVDLSLPALVKPRGSLPVPAGPGWAWLVNELSGIRASLLFYSGAAVASPALVAVTAVDLFKLGIFFGSGCEHIERGISDLAASFRPFLAHTEIRHHAPRPKIELISLPRPSDLGGIL